ncbi:MAG: hypothetical protein CMJ78_26725 [Planctomycetaceae bacterium]|nr:hypothetical protein [Planctomycetaceae bacterium]
MASENVQRYFTVEEANQRLPLVRAIVGDIVELFEYVYNREQSLREISELPGSSSRDEETIYSEELRLAAEELEDDKKRLKGYFDELEDLGIELKDPRIGLIDFRSMMDGREVYLCWKLGEDEVTHWHELDAGFQGRQSLLEQPVGESF